MWLKLERRIQNDIFDGQLYNIVTKNATVQDIINEISLLNSNLKIKYVKVKIWIFNFCVNILLK